ARPWRPGTSTTTALPTWPPALLGRRLAALAALVQGVCCRARAAGVRATGGRLFAQGGGTPEIGDQFGFVLAVGDFNNNGVADLAVGAPFEAVGSASGGGGIRGAARRAWPSAAPAVPVQSVCCTARSVD